MNKTCFAYDNSAENYEEKFDGFTEYESHISAFGKLFDKNDRILDIGCGPGLNSKIFADNDLKITGIDFSSKMISLAQRNCPQGVFHKISVNDFSTELKFDGICLSFIIVHLSNSEVESLISKVSKLAINNAKIYISFMSGKTSGYEKTSFSDNEIFFNYFETEFIIEKCEENGMKLFSSEVSSYQEDDGTFTNDNFLIFEKN